MSASLVGKYRYSRGWVIRSPFASSRVCPSKPHSAKNATASRVMMASRWVGSSRGGPLVALRGRALADSFTTDSSVGVDAFSICTTNRLVLLNRYKQPTSPRRGGSLVRKGQSPYLIYQMINNC